MCIQLAAFKFTPPLCRFFWWSPHSALHGHFWLGGGEGGCWKVKHVGQTTKWKSCTPPSVCSMCVSGVNRKGAWVGEKHTLPYQFRPANKFRDSSKLKIESSNDLENLKASCNEALNIILLLLLFSPSDCFYSHVIINVNIRVSELNRPPWLYTVSSLLLLITT